MLSTWLATFVFQAPADASVQLASCLIDFFLYFKANVLSEEAILKWYNEAHVAKGKSIFVEQMRKFVEWLKNAEEGEHLAVSSFPYLCCLYSVFFCHT